MDTSVLEEEEEEDITPTISKGVEIFKDGPYKFNMLLILTDRKVISFVEPIRFLVR